MMSLWVAGNGDDVLGCQKSIMHYPKLLQVTRSTLRPTISSTDRGLRACDAVYFAQAKSAIAQINKYPRLYLRALKNQYRNVDVAPEREPSLDPLFKSLEGRAVVGRLAGVLIGYMTKWIVKHL